METDKAPKPFVFAVPTESEEQRLVFQWAELEQGRWPELRWLYHIPNEGRRNTATGARMRAEGLKRGVPDICLPIPRDGFCGLYIELKRTKGGKTTSTQKEWLEELAKAGHYTALCKGADEAIAVLQKYLRLERVNHANH